MKNLRDFIRSNTVKLSATRKNEIYDFDKRVLNNIKKIGGFEIPDNISTVYDLLLYVDENNGICNLEGCTKNKKLKAGRKWILNDFCSIECSSRDFSKRQTENNTSRRMSEDSKNRMKSKLSEIIRDKIKKGEFTPSVTNSWAHSKIKVLIGEKIFNVRSSWEAFFYVLNPHLVYESIRIQYLDEDKGLLRNYIVDFFDPLNKRLYEIKPSKKMDLCKYKNEAAQKWCKDNNFEFFYITEDWIKDNYNRSLILDQPDFLKISSRIEKSIKYGR